MNSSGNTSLSDQDLAEGFRQGGVSGPEVMTRLLGKVGLEHRRHEVLRRHDGSDLTGEDGQALSVLDYMSVAERHSGAVLAILRFVGMDESAPAFPDTRDGMRAIVNGYLPPDASVSST